MLEMRFLKKEVFKAILLNTKNRILEVIDVSIGSLNSSIVHPREVYACAVKLGASGICFAHNHRRTNMLTYDFGHNILGTK